MEAFFICRNFFHIKVLQLATIPSLFRTFEFTLLDMKYIIILALSLCPLGLNAQKILLKGDNTSMVNLYGPKALRSVPITQTPTIQPKSYAAKGFKILVYFGSDRDKATQAQSQVSKNFGLSTSLAFLSPNYHVKAGDFGSRQEAELFLDKISRKFPDAVIVSDVVNITQD